MQQLPPGSGFWLTLRAFVLLWAAWFGWALSYLLVKSIAGGMFVWTSVAWSLCFVLLVLPPRVLARSLLLTAGLAAPFLGWWGIELVDALRTEHGPWPVAWFGMLCYPTAPIVQLLLVCRVRVQWSEAAAERSRVLRPTNC